MENHIEKEDIYIAIAKSAIRKMQFLFSDNNNTYFHNGREYHEYDVPVFIALSGFANEKSQVEIYHNCVMQMLSRRFSPDPEKLNQIVEIVRNNCQEEIHIVRETDKRFSTGESSISIYKDIMDSLNQ